MGTDKATIEVDGVPMARRVADALAEAGAETVVAIGGDVAALHAAGLDARADVHPGEGPLGAVTQVLSGPGNPVIAILACDLLRPDPASIRALVARRAESDADVVVPVSGGRPQWAHAVWHRRVASVLGAVFASGERSIVGATAGLSTELFELDDPTATDDADHPADLPPRAREAAFAPGAPTIPGVEIPVIDIDTLARELEGGAPVFDVREPDEYEEAHVPGVRLVPLAEVPDRVDEFPTSGDVYVICKSGGRSARAVEFLRSQGVDAVNVAGGTMAWIESGKPVDRGV